MSVIARAMRLPWRDRIDAARALGWLVGVHVALRLLPYRRVRGIVGRVGRSSRSLRLTAAECGAAIARASVLFPAAECLARAMAAECLLRRAGRDAHLRFGAGFDEAHALQAHAWLESAGAIVTGRGLPDQFAPLD